MHKLIFVFGVIGGIAGCSGPADVIKDQLIEVERLDQLKQKTADIVIEQEQQILSLMREFDVYSSDMERDLGLQDQRIKEAEVSLTYWERWHINRPIIEFHDDSLRIERRLHALDDSLFFLTLKEPGLKQDLAHYEIYPEAFAGSILDKRKEYEMLVVHIANLKTQIETLKKEAVVYRDNSAKARYKTPGRKLKEIGHAQNEVVRLRGDSDRLLQEFEAKRKSYHDRIIKMKNDLTLIRHALDSLSNMHTAAVFELSKTQNRD